MKSYWKDLAIASLAMIDEEANERTMKKAAHRGSVTWIVGQFQGAIYSADVAQLKQQKISLTEKLTLVET